MIFTLNIIPYIPSLLLHYTMKNAVKGKTLCKRYRERKEYWGKGFKEKMSSNDKSQNTKRDKRQQDERRKKSRRRRRQKLQKRIS